MKKNAILKFIATNGYNVGFGAKKHFATFDIVEKVPGIISFFAIAFGILSLKYCTEQLNGHVSVVLTIFGVVSLYISHYLNIKKRYEETGIQITQIFNQLYSIYLDIKQSSKQDFSDEQKKIEQLMATFYEISITNQILFSDWFAHYKFFYQMQIDWIDEQLSFSTIKDKIPRSFLLLVIFLIVALILFYGAKAYNIIIFC